MKRSEVEKRREVDEMIPVLKEILSS